MDAFVDAIELWGERAQMFMAIKEMAELTDKLTKNMRGMSVSLESLAEEVADVRIMMEQLVIILDGKDGGNPSLYWSKYKEKMERLKERIQESQSDQDEKECDDE